MAGGSLILNENSLQAQGLVGWWPLGDGHSVLDYSINSTAATPNKSPVVTINDGRHCLSFDGVDQYIDTNRPLLGSDVVSVCFWVKFNTVTKNWQSVFDAFGSAGDRNFQIWLATDSYLYVWHRDDLLDANHRFTNTLSTDTWYHIGYSEGQAYLNGVPDATITYGADAALVADVFLGQRADGASTSRVDGFLADARLYDGELSAGQFQQIFQQTRDGSYGDLARSNSTTVFFPETVAATGLLPIIQAYMARR